jgi:competence protein ComEA
MLTDRQSKPPRWPVLFLGRRDQAVAACFLMLALLAIGFHWTWQAAHRRRLIEIDQVQPELAEFRVDINAANWPELALMPGVGEVLAKRIVDDREANGSFHDHDNLRRVRGIGPKTLDGMRPYLVPMPDASATAGAVHQGRLEAIP